MTLDDTGQTGTDQANEADQTDQAPATGPPAVPELRKISDARTLRALAHPVRIALIETLTIEGAMTATEIGESIGESPTTCSFHLRQLAKYGFVEEAGGGKGRARPWRMTSIGMSLTAAHDDPEAEIAASAVIRLFRERQLDRTVGQHEEQDQSDDAEHQERTAHRLAPVPVTGPSGQDQHRNGRRPRHHQDEIGGRCRQVALVFHEVDHEHHGLGREVDQDGGHADQDQQPPVRRAQDLRPAPGQLALAGSGEEARALRDPPPQHGDDDQHRHGRQVQQPPGKAGRGQDAPVQDGRPARAEGREHGQPAEAEAPDRRRKLLGDHRPDQHALGAQEETRRKLAADEDPDARGRGGGQGGAVGGVSHSKHHVRVPR